MKVCLITANLPPVRCGVGDYTVHVATTLARRGDDVVLLTGRNQADALPGAPFKVRNTLRSWGPSGMRDLWRAVKEERPDVVLLQWVPFLYSRTGTNLALPFTLAMLAASGVRLRVMVHEPWVRFIWWSFFITGPIQRLALATIITASEHVSVSITAWRNMLRRRFPWKRERIDWSPVGSNIPVVPVANPAQVRESAGIPPDALLLGVFSLSGAAKAFNLTEAAWQAVAASRPDAHVVLIGATDAEATNALPGIAADPRCHTTGPLSAAAVSAWLQTVDVLLAPFSDGMSSRRTSVMAAMSHGVPVLTTLGALTDDVLVRGPLCLSAIDPAIFGEAAVALSSDAGRRAVMGPATRDFYERNFAWPIVVEQLLPPVGSVGSAHTSTLEAAARVEPR